MKTVIAFLFLLFAIGCKDAPSNPEEKNFSDVSSCVGCHTNHDFLKQVYSPDTTIVAGEGGCGGETPHIEPYDRVYMGGEDFISFKNSYHGKLSCVECHNGVDGTSDKKIAHSKNFIRHPSTVAEEKCGSCHSSVTTMSKNSLHEQGWGQKYALKTRYGVNSFTDLPQILQKAYDTNCARCHGGCGDCHVLRPSATGGGLMKSHKFFAPSPTDNCVSCHSSRGGHGYYGIGVGTEPDVHLTKANFTCVTCHKQSELHGNGKIVERRYLYDRLPKCENCHSNLATKNNFHITHINDLNCNVCHSQDYNNCASCHIEAEGARVPAYLGFKIGVNPIKPTKSYKFATLRRALMAPDSWDKFGVQSLANFNSLPTYKYATPHNILRWTKRTKVENGKACFDACHIIKEGENYRNKQYYLFNSDMQFSWENDANKVVVVDGKLPPSWGVNK